MQKVKVKYDNSKMVGDGLPSLAELVLREGESSNIRSHETSHVHLLCCIDEDNIAVCNRPYTVSEVGYDGSRRAWEWIT